MRKSFLIKVPIDATFYILDHEINGYTALSNAVEVSSTKGRKNEQNQVEVRPHITNETPKEQIPGLHVLEIYERFPCFDSHDFAYEDRFYRFFFFSDRPFTEDEIIRIACEKNVDVPVKLPEWALPAVAYADESEVMCIVS